MNAGQMQILSVWRCAQCNKPFDKQSTLKRHAYYCRSRRHGTSRRPRSCVACARGKVACDNERPQCSRCASKNIECQYPGDTSRPAASGVGAHLNASATNSRGRVSLPMIESPSNALSGPNEDPSGIFVGDMLSLSNQNLSNIGDEYPAWDDADMDCTSLLDTQPYHPYLTPGLSDLSYSAAPYPTHQPSHSPQSPSIPRSPNATERSLVHRQMTRAGTQRIAKLILHNLKSYPLMIGQGDNLPPFIHKSLLTSSDKDMEPLANCLSLVRLLSGGIEGSRKLFWKNVCMECEQWSEEHGRMSKWELLAAMQALTIYVIVRLDQGRTENNTVDFLLVKAVTAVAQQLNRADVTCHAQCMSCNNGLEMSWKEWIFRESGRRIGVVYRVVDMLVYFEPTALCDIPDDLVLAPLPAKRQLWEAADEFAWKAASFQEPDMQVAFGLAKNGEIVRLEGRLSCTDAWVPQTEGLPSRSTASWEEWCANADGFGGLVMLAASLTG